MAARNSIRQALGASATRFLGSATWIVAGALVLSVVCLVSLRETAATASYAVAFSRGGLLLLGAMAVGGSAKESRACLAECRQERVPRMRRC
jgi:hypothetical protein